MTLGSGSCVDLRSSLKHASCIGASAGVHAMLATMITIMRHLFATC
jgi:hypothetical protein